MLGQTISHYQILEKLGQGGMGEVYLAEDSRLGRKVALKFLAPELARDRESLIRFRNEARAAAELSHSNIATIYDIGEADEKSFLVLEYLRGQTLRDRIAQGPLPIDDVLRVGQALAAGLAEAHSHGIVHRDIKSANVMLTEKGETKILDFGLAHRGDATQLTRPGTTLGTVHYMSPEQAAGEKADERSDLWSVGIVLYECLTGRPPFQGELQSVFAQIAHSEPARPTALRTDIPVELEQLVLRCIEKDPKLRFQHADDLLAGLRGIESRRDSGTLHSAARPAAEKGLRIGPRSLVGLFVLIAVALLMWQQPWLSNEESSKERSPGTKLSPPRITPFLTTSAVESSPAWSPLNNLIAYAANTDGVWDVWLCDLDGSNPLNLTASASTDDRYPAWSPDGQRIAFYSDRDGPGIYTMTITGGNIRRLLPVKPFIPGNFLFCMQWLDADRLIYSDSDESGRPDVYEYRLDLDESRCLTEATPDGAHYGRMNKAGSHLVYVRPWLGADTSIYVQSLATGEVHTMPLAGLDAFWSADDQFLLVISSRDGSSDLWTQELNIRGGGEGGSFQRVTTAVPIGNLALSPDGSQAIATKGETTHNVWSFPTDVGPITSLRQGQKHTEDRFNHSFPRWLGNEDAFIEISDRRGAKNLWKVDLPDGKTTRLTTEESFAGVPSPDGKRIIAALLDESGGDFPFLLRPDGSGLRELSRPLRDQFVFASITDWDSMGRHLALHTKVDDEWAIGVVELDEEQQSVLGVTIMPERGAIPFWSPDGRFLAFQRTENEQQDLFVVDVQSTEVHRLTDSEMIQWISGWEANPSRIYFKDGVRESVYRVSMGTDGRALSEPELWFEGTPEVYIRHWLDFRNGRALGAVSVIESDFILMDFEGETEIP